MSKLAHSGDADMDAIERQGREMAERESVQTEHPASHVIIDALQAELVAHRAVSDAARELDRLMNEVEQDEAGQNDRVFAHFEFDQLRYALELVDNLKGGATSKIEDGQS